MTVKNEFGFFLTVPSDSSLNMFPNNTQCCFKAHLPKIIHIDKEEWEVALVQLTTPSQFLNISEEEAQCEIITTDSLLIKTILGYDRKGDNMQISPFRRNE